MKVGGNIIDLKKITAPLLTIVAEDDDLISLQSLEVTLNYAQVKWHMRSYGQKQQNGLSQIDNGQKSNSIWSRHLKKSLIF